MEIWKDCVNLPFYQVSSLGRVRSLARVVISKNGVAKNIKGRILALGNLNGYKTFAVFSPSVKSYLVHREVLKSFVGMPPEGMQCCHENGIRHDNRLENLRWDTPYNNTHDKYKHKTMLANQNHPMAKITDKQALEIKLSKLPTKTLMAIYGLSKSHTESIRAGRFRKNLL